MTLQLDRPRSGRDSLGPIAGAVDAALEDLERSDAIRRIWARDYTLWSDQRTEITNRLGWLTVAETMRKQTDDLARFADEVADDGIRDVVLLGMGGSSLAAEVLATTLGTEAGRPRLTVLDTSDPVTIAGVERGVDLARTLFIAASKSGDTIETTSLLAYFWEQIPDGSHFITITDPGSPLQALGQARGFRRIFINPPDIGGRYSALSYFGLVPAALIGVDLERLLNGAVEMQRACGADVSPFEHPAARLGAALGVAARSGRDKLTLVMDDDLTSFAWVEQLIAESTGKDGRGILPVEGEPFGAPEVYGDDRIFVAVGEVAGLDNLERAGHPLVRLPFEGTSRIGGSFFRWEFATAVAGHVLGVHPFNQPNVRAAKDATARILEGEDVDDTTPPVDQLLAAVEPGDYIALQAFVPRDWEHAAELDALRLRLRDRYGVATTVGFGPRFLHSTGQLHKAGPPNGVFIQILSEGTVDLGIPGQPYSFGQLKRAQALGDLDSLRAVGRRVTRISLDDVDRLCR